MVATIQNRCKYLLPLLSCTLVACTHQPYPEAWPRPLAKLEPDGCTALTGTYRDGPAGLFDMLTKYGGYQRDFDYVRVGMPEKGVLLFEAVITSYSIHYTKLYECRVQELASTVGNHRR